MTKERIEAIAQPGAEEFATWFRRNYPGPDTIIHKPDWHAPKIFRAAIAAYRQSVASEAAGKQFRFKVDNGAWSSWFGSSMFFPEVAIIETRNVFAAPPVPPGWKLMPVEPTEEMVEAGKRRTFHGKTTISILYEVMLEAAPAPQPVTATYSQAECDELCEIAERDGYEKAVQEIDKLTGGDGEYRYCTNHDPDRHTPDAPAMIQRIIDRFEALKSAPAAPGWKLVPKKLTNEMRLAGYKAPNKERGMTDFSEDEFAAIVNDPDQRRFMDAGWEAVLEAAPTPDDNT